MLNSEEVQSTAETSPNAPQSSESHQETVSLESTGITDMLPEDLRGNETLAQFKDVGSLAKSYVEARSMLGSMVRIPGEDAGQEQLQEFYNKLDKIPGLMRAPNPEDAEAMAAFYNTLGRPENPEGYTLEAPEGMEFDAAQSAQFKQLAHEAGLTNQQVQKLQQFEASRIQAGQEALVQERQQAEAQLQEVWGNDASNRLQGAKATFRHYAEQYPEAAQQLEAVAGNNPVLLMLMSEMGKTLIESGTIKGVGSPQYGMSPQEAQAQIAEIMGNPNHAYYQEGTVDHTKAVERMQQLYQAAYPETK
jgi:hypothetical protein